MNPNDHQQLGGLVGGGRFQNATAYPPSVPSPNFTLTNQLSAACNEIVELTERLRAVNDRVNALPRSVEGPAKTGPGQQPSLASMAAVLRASIDLMRDEVARLDVSV